MFLGAQLIKQLPTQLPTQLPRRPQTWGDQNLVTANPNHYRKNTETDVICF